jgi:hypothetical protein
MQFDQMSKLRCPLCGRRDCPSLKELVRDLRLRGAVDIDADPYVLLTDAVRAEKTPRFSPWKN